MNCGYDCPCCSGSGDCETCDAMMIYEDNWKNTIVEGVYLGGTYDGYTIPDYNGDPCHLNIVKCVACGFEMFVKRECFKKVLE